MENYKEGVPTCFIEAHRVLYYFVGNIYYYIFFIAFLARYNKHKNIGKYNLKAPRPRTYLIKLGL